MRMSCNGCRVLRKGCSENCSIRPCLQWIKSPDSQANATVFLAKFYGRAGLLNLINSGPEHLRPAIFRSLLYEACGRIVNPIYGSVGLLWSGSWQLCQAAVEAVLKGSPITPINSDLAANSQGPPLKPYDIRHVSKEDSSLASHDLSKAKPRRRVRKAKLDKPGDAVVDLVREEFTRSTSHDSSLSHHSELAAAADAGESKETESMLSVETAEPSLLLRAEPELLSADKKNGETANENTSSTETPGVGLELTLGLEPMSCARHVVPVKKRRVEADACKIGLGLGFTRAG